MAVETSVDEATKAMHEATSAMRASLAEAEKSLEARGLQLKQAVGDIEKADGVTGDLKERLVKAEDGIVKAEDRWNELAAEVKENDRIRGELETKLDLIKTNRPGSEDEAKAEIALYERAYSKALAGGTGQDTRARTVVNPLNDEEEKALDDFEAKSLSTDGGETGGYLMPPAQRGELIRKLILADPLEDLASSVDLASGDTWEAPREGDQNFECDWVSERGARPETDAGKLGLETIVAHEIYAKPLATQKMLDDPGFDVAGWLTNRLSRRFGVKRGQAFIAGDGSGKPEGIVVSPTAIGTGDFGFVPMGDASTIADGDGLWDVFIDLEEFYAAQSTWLWQRATTGIIRKLKAQGTGEYLWAPAFEGIPPSVAERPYRESISMPAVAANAFAVALGDWESAYLVVRRQEIRTLRDPFSSKPFVEFYTTMRTGGAPVLNEAYRLGKIAV